MDDFNLKEIDSTGYETHYASQLLYTTIELQ